jgi:hypothetical protein
MHREEPEASWCLLGTVLDKGLVTFDYQTDLFDRNPIASSYDYALSNRAIGVAETILAACKRPLNGSHVPIRNGSGGSDLGGHPKPANDGHLKTGQ